MLNIESIIKNIYCKAEELVKSDNSQVKSEIVLEIMDLMNKLNREQVVDLMADSNELIRNIASRVYIEKYFDDSLDFICQMLNAEDENIRDSAVLSICHLKSPNNLELLEKAAQDESSSVKLRALTGIADIAFDYANQSAKTILETFLSNEDPVIREFVQDELSLIPA